MLDAAAVQFQLLFSGSLIAHTAACTALSGKGFPHSYQPGKQILQPGRLYLEFGLSGLRPGRKDIQDKRSPVQNRLTQLLLQVAQLGRRKCIVENNNIRFQILCKFPYLPDLATSDIKSFIHHSKLLRNHSCHLHVTGLCQTAKLIHGPLEIDILPCIRTN